MVWYGMLYGLVLHGLLWYGVLWHNYDVTPVAVHPAKRSRSVVSRTVASADGTRELMHLRPA